MCFPLTSFQLLRAWHQPMLHAEKEQRFFWRHEQRQVSLSGKWATWWSQPSPPFCPGTGWQGKWAPRRFTALMGSPELRPPEQPEQVEDWSNFSECCPTLVENSNMCHIDRSGRVTGTLKYKETKQQNMRSLTVQNEATFVFRWYLRRSNSSMAKWWPLKPK